MKHKILFCIFLCFLLIGFSTAQKEAFMDEVELIQTSAEDQEVIDPYVYPQLAAQDTQRITILTSVTSVKVGNYSYVKNYFSLSEIDSLFFQCQVFSLEATKVVFRFLVIHPGSEPSLYFTGEYDFPANNYYLVNLEINPKTVPWSAGTHKVIVMADLQQDGSASGASSEMYFRLY